MERARAPACPRPYTPRRPEHSPLYRVLADHFDRLERVHEECFEGTHGPLRPAACRAAARFLDCDCSTRINRGRAYHLGPVRLQFPRTTLRTALRAPACTRQKYTPGFTRRAS